MRDVNRINEIMELLGKGWQKVPQWRFGQLIENFKRYVGVSDLFYVEDDVLKQKIIEFFELHEE